MKLIQRSLSLVLIFAVARLLLANDSTATTSATSAIQKPSCCAVASPGQKDASCETRPATAFSKNSIYQLDASFTSDTGQPYSLGELRGRPVVLTMFFSTCGYACPLVVSDLQAIRTKLPEEIRNHAAFVLISFDVARDTPAALAHYRQQRGLGPEWILLHGEDEGVREVAALLGVKFKRESDGAFSHSNLITILNAQGEIVHQRAGLQGGLDEAAAAVR